MNDYETIVIGAGLSGLTAAACLCGHSSVCLVSNSSIGAHKPCGGLVSPEAHEYIQRLDIGFGSYHSENTIPLYINYEGRDMLFRFYAVDRDELNRNIHEKIRNKIRTVTAAETEIKFSDGKYHVTDTKTSTTYSGKYLLVADGVNSSSRVKLGYQKPSAILVEQTIIRMKSEMAKFIFDREITPGYYYWMIPKGTETIFGYPAENKSKVIKDIKRRYGVGISEKDKRERYYLTKIRHSDEINLGRNNHFILGEAAGLVMPQTGEGITCAVASAFLASKAITGPGRKKSDTYKNLMSDYIEKIKLDLQMAAASGSH